MVIASQLKSLLDGEHVSYHVLEHHQRFTSPEIAQALHVPGRLLAKVVMVRAGDRLSMVVLPADRFVDLEAFARAVGADGAELATEEQFRDAFPDCEVGAMPPFGNLYDVPVVVDRSLTADEEIVFQAGNHTEAIQLAYEDYARLVHPHVADVAQRRPG